MAFKETVKELRELLHAVTSDLDKAESGNKAASQRVRTGTVKIEKVAKRFRKESITTEKKTKGTKKPAKAAAKKHPAKKAAHKPAHKAAAKKSHSHKAAKAVAKPRHLAVKRATAKLPQKRFGWN